MNFKIYTEEEWFDKFYPKSWGDWRKFYNAKAYINHKDESGCTWMDYTEIGYLSGTDKDGMMKVNKWNEYKPCIESFFIECGDEKDPLNIPWFLQPYYQSKTGKYYAKVVVSEVESNLELYKIHVKGNDDSSYTKHFINDDNLQQGIDDIKNYGVSHIQERDSEYFFTN